ncbi:MAG: C-type lectin domain-containing protein [Planctomycetota bacterium]
MPQLILVALACLPTLAAAQAKNPDADTIAASVREAEQSFRLQVLKEKSDLTLNIKTIVDREIQRAVAAGDLDTLESLQAQLKAFGADGTPPDVPATRSHVQNYQKKLTRLGDALVKVYETATRRYTQALDVDNARLMQDKISWTRPTTGLGTVARRGRVYLLVQGKMSWTQAKAACEQLGGYLACLNDKSEHRFVFEKLINGKKIAAWIGGTDAQQEGKWVWLDGTDDYWVWNKKEPNNLKGAQHYAALTGQGTFSDFYENDKLVTAYIVEWDSVPTRETIYQTGESQKRESAEIETLQTATLKHNERILVERDRLQSAILTAKDEAAIAQARTSYDEQVASVKQDYLAKLEIGLKRAVADDRLEVAGDIKTQILRVQRQLARLTKEQAPAPDVPVLDEGNAETPTDDTSDAPDLADNLPGEAEDAGGPDDTGTFFGLPLE